MFDLKDKRAVVTGASGGIGAAIATALHQQGARVTLSGRNAQALERLAAQLGAHSTIAPVALDDDDAPQTLLQKATEAMGGVDMLINNAGITDDTLVLRMQDAQWDQVINVNLRATFRLTRAFLRPMIKARFGRVVTITSIVGATGNPGQANYAASKAGLEGMTRSLAREVATRGITLNCIAPGLIDTAMAEDLTPNARAALQANIPTGALGRPEDVAAGVAYLCSDEAGYVTGQTLHINGGMAMGV